MSREGQRSRVSGIECGRRYVGLRGKTQYEAGDNSILRTFMVCTSVACIGEREMRAGFWWVNMRQDLGIGERVILTL
jgi:hypothetical protein